MNKIKESFIDDVDKNKSDSDNFGANSIVLVKLNKLSNQNKKSVVINTLDCDEIDNYIIKDKRIVFESVYKTGKKIFLAFKDSEYNTISDYRQGMPTDSSINDLYTNLFNDYVFENGYPYLIGTLPSLNEKIICPEYFEFIDSCFNIYVIEELRKWVFKERKKIEDWEMKKKNGININIDTREFKIKYNIIKDELIYAMENQTSIIIYDDIDKKEVIDTLKKGIQISKEKLTDKDIEDFTNFLKVLQRTLIYYILSIINGTYKKQYTITKQLPIYNEETLQYRLYTIAYSLMGIAYDSLLFSLTALNKSYMRKICEFPQCNNEFEPYGRTKYCDCHSNEEIRAYTKHLSYMKKKDTK